MSFIFAEQSQIDEVLGYLDEIQEYQTTLQTLVKTLAGYIEAYENTFPQEDRAGIKIRYITSEGRDDELWRGHLLSASPGRKKVNLWCLTITKTSGLSQGKGQAASSFDKPVSVGVDYFYDWDYGTDEDNSEDFFNKKIDGVDFIFEQIRTCLPDNAELISWDFRRMIKRFTNASTHLAKGDIELKIEGL